MVPRNPDLFNDKPLSGLDKACFYRTNSYEDNQNNPDLPSPNHRYVMNTATSNDQEVLSNSESVRQTFQIESYSHEIYNSNPDVTININTPCVYEMFNKSKVDPLQTENTENIQRLLPNPDRGIIGPAFFEVSGSNYYSHQSDENIFKASHRESKERKISSDRMMTDNNQPLIPQVSGPDWLNECTITDEDEPVASLVPGLDWMNDQIISSNNNTGGLNYNLEKNINASTSMQAYDSTQLTGISEEFSINDPSVFLNRTLQGVEHFAKNSHLTTGKNTASNISTSKNENVQDIVSCCGESKEENACYDNAAVPGASGKKTSKCEICEKNINDHAVFHEGKRMFQCCLCKIKCFVKDAFKVHIKRHDPEHFFCKICGELFKEKGSHETLQICNICEEKFLCKTFLLEHSLNHPEYCVICWKEIDQHISEGTVRTLFKCCNCEQKEGKSRLRKHVYSHFEEKAFRCDECGKRYRYESNLVQHRRKHIEKLQ